MKTKTTVRKINLKHFPYAYSQVRQETGVGRTHRNLKNTTRKNRIAFILKPNKP
jgi:hypothetical protein